MTTYSVIKATPKPKPQVGEEGGPAVVSSGPDGVDVVTFGCRLNAYEGEVIRRQAQGAGRRAGAVQRVEHHRAHVGLHADARRRAERHGLERHGVGRAHGGCRLAIALALVARAAVQHVAAASGAVEKAQPQGLVAQHRFAAHELHIAGQLRGEPGSWRLHALNPAYPDATLDSLDAVRGVVIQAAVPGRRRATRRYV